MKMVLPLLLLTAACNEEQALSPTPEESRRLDETEALLNGLNEEGPAPEGTDPSNHSD